MSEVRTNAENRAILEHWMRSYRPEELFDDDGRLLPGARRRCRPTGTRRMSANPVANGGELLRDLELPDFRDYAVDVPTPGGDAPPRRRASSARTSATSWTATPTTSGCSGRTRRPRTGWAPSSR